MTYLSVSQKIVCVSNSKDTIVFPSDGKGEDLVIEHPCVNTKENNSSSSSNKPEDNYDGSVPTVTSAFSPCGSFFACCSHKSLSLWNTDKWTLICNKTIERSISKMIFSPEGNAIIVADKSGFVYAHYLNDFKEPGSLLMSHISMLIDILITRDQKYIITCDRDEKIRVSCFPDAFNIVSYCLAHEEFVSSINILPNDSKTLLSSGGDGTFRIWDFVKGKEILCYDVRENISSITKKEVDQPPVIYKVSLQESEDATLLCSLIYKINGVWVHRIKKSESLLFELVSFVTTDSAPYCLNSFISSKYLWLLQLSSDQPILALNLESNKLIVEAYINHIQEKVRSHLNGIDLISLQEKLITSLCKKKFDNESAYYKRKNERLEAEKVKKPK